MKALTIPKGGPVAMAGIGAATSVVESVFGYLEEREQTRRVELACEALVTHVNGVCGSMEKTLAHGTKRIELMCRALTSVPDPQTQQALVLAMRDLVQAEARTLGAGMERMGALRPIPGTRGLIEASWSEEEGG